MRRDVPEPWAGWLIAAGLKSPNAHRDIASARQLADRVGVHTTTVMNMMHGATDTDPATVAAVAEALRLDVRTVSRQVGQARTEQTPWVPPFEANLLSRRQQRALSELIRAMAAEESGPRGDTASMKRVSATPMPAGQEPPQGSTRRRPAGAPEASPS